MAEIKDLEGKIWRKKNKANSIITILLLAAQ